MLGFKIEVKAAELTAADVTSFTNAIDSAIDGDTNSEQRYSVVNQKLQFQRRYIHSKRWPKRFHTH